ncbi:MAG: prolipoprotein diacylglyceryl transferase [Rhodospirillales bacterium]|nr:prolipoprotein diacylglyceryl transferase [Rhodospirillales bacterium]
MTFVLAFPTIDPVLIEIGPIAIRWYGLAYVVGLLLGWRIARRLASGPPQVTTPQNIDDFLVWATLGVILGGRLGSIIFYNFDYYLNYPLDVFKIWQGGMSFHGGFLGVVIAGWLFVKRKGIDPLAFGDILACAAPIGLFFGRIANFINGELYGRPTDVPWAMIFPTDEAGLPRHPSQLYQAALEGLVLFLLLYFLWRVDAVRRRSGVLIGVFLIGYAVARSFAEFFRQPDAHIGFLAAGTTMGQLLSLPMLLVGVWLILRAKPRD